MYQVLYESSTNPQQTPPETVFHLRLIEPASALTLCLDLILGFRMVDPSIIISPKPFTLKDAEDLMEPCLSSVA